LWLTFWVSDHPISGATPTPPYPSQVGVDFSDFWLIGVELSLWGWVFNFGDYPILAIRAPNKPGFGLLGWKSGDLSCGPLPASFSQTPTRHRGFVSNKGPSAIRPSGDRAVEALFSPIFHAQSRIFRLALILFSKTSPPDTLPPEGQ
jgi:hypothetical protein